MHLLTLGHVSVRESLDDSRGVSSARTGFSTGAVVKEGCLRGTHAPVYTTEKGGGIY